MKSRIFLFVFLIIGLIGSLIGTIWTIFAIVFSPNGTRALNIILAYDRLFSATTGGTGQETLSSRAGRLSKENTKWACFICKFLDWLQKDHCKNSIGI